jgi:hypothetical protein
MTALPTELWLIIFELVIPEGIIGVDQCDHTTFPYIQSILSAPHIHYHAYDSYYRLRLVCRSFKAILGDPPSQILSPTSIFPLSTTIRALVLDLDAWSRTNFQLPSAELLSCRRIVYLDVTCGLIPNSDHPNLSDFLGACKGRAFHEVQRLTLRIMNNSRFMQYEEKFWFRLHDVFPLLVTLVITHENPNGEYIMLEAADGVVSFEYLEVLYLGHRVWFAGCRFPRLRHASVWSFSRHSPETFAVSSYLESLLIRSFHDCPINLGSYSRLKSLGTLETLCYRVVPPEGDHPLEHLWIFIYEKMKNSRSTMELLKRLPRILRVTFDLSSVTSDQMRAQRTEKLRRIEFGSIGLKMRPRVRGDNLLVLERSSESNLTVEKRGRGPWSWSVVRGL